MLKIKKKVDEMTKKNTFYPLLQKMLGGGNKKYFYFCHFIYFFSSLSCQVRASIQEINAENKLCSEQRRSWQRMHKFSFHHQMFGDLNHHFVHLFL